MFVDSQWVQELISLAVTVRTIFLLDQARNSKKKWNLVLQETMITDTEELQQKHLLHELNISYEVNPPPSTPPQPIISTTTVLT